MKSEPHARRKLEMEEGPKALENFTQTMKALFRVPKSAVQNNPPKRSHRKTTKAGS
jgi:hypothetical protein